MINIRYHIVSITAVFLALGIGVALGSTFLDRATVDVLNRNIRSAENRIAATNEENERLSEELDDAEERDTALIVVGSEELLADHLTDVPTLVVTAPGVDADRVDALRSVLETSGADLRGTLQLRDPMRFEGTADQDLAADLDLDDASAPEIRDATFEQLTAALAAAGTPVDAAEPPADPDPTEEPEVPEGEAGVPAPDGEQPEIVATLLEREYLAIDPGPGYADDDPILEAPGYRYVFVGVPGLDATSNDALLRLLPADEATAPLPAVVATSTDPQPVEGEVAVPNVVAQLRADEARRERYTTVDNAETFAGLSAVVLSLEDIETAVPGQYGQADGATAVLPARS